MSQCRLFFIVTSKSQDGLGEIFQRSTFAYGCRDFLFQWQEECMYLVVVGRQKEIWKDSCTHSHLLVRQRIVEYIPIVSTQSSFASVPFPLRHYGASNGAPSSIDAKMDNT